MLHAVLLNVVKCRTKIAYSRNGVLDVDMKNRITALYVHKRAIYFVKNIQNIYSHNRIYLYVSFSICLRMMCILFYVTINIFLIYRKLITKFDSLLSSPNIDKVFNQFLEIAYACCSTSIKTSILNCTYYVEYVTLF